MTLVTRYLASPVGVALLAGILSAGLVATPVGASADPVSQLTANAFNDQWDGTRNSTTSQGKVLWYNADNFTDVWFWNGSSATNIASTDHVESTVFGLGSGAAPGSVIGAWRSGGNGDMAWVYTSDNNTLTRVNVPTQLFENVLANPEGLAIADGCVFMIFQSFSGGNAVKQVYRVDPATGNVVNLSGIAPVNGAARLKTGGCQAAWIFDASPAGTADPTQLQLQFYNGTGVTTVDSGAGFGFKDAPYSVSVRDGVLVYAKGDANGIPQIFMYDSTAANPAPVQLTLDTTGANVFSRTDGEHVAWVHQAADGTNAHIMLLGGIQLTTTTTRLPDEANRGNSFTEHPFQLDRGQLFWRDLNGVLRYAVGGTMTALDIFPATAFGGLPWLADGFIAFWGLSSDGGTDHEVFLFTGTPPAGPTEPAAPLLFGTPGNGQITLSWDQVLGATSYNIYLAQQCPVTKDNWAQLPGGRAITGVTSPLTITNLVGNTTYCFVITAVENGVEGTGSQEFRQAFIGTLAWQPTGGLSSVVFPAVAADKTNAMVAYAGGAGTGLNCKGATPVPGCDVYRTTDGGGTWTAVTGSLNPIDTRALAVNGSTVFAATRDVFNGKSSLILRSPDAGASWTAVVPDGGQIGETNKSLAIDPLTPATVYAGDVKLPGMNALTQSLVVKSTDGGTSWADLTQAPGLGDDLRAYAIAVDPVTAGTVYAGGTGTPNLAKSLDGGTTWTDASSLPAPNYVYALAIDPTRSSTLYAGTQSNGVYKSTNGGRTWAQTNTGLPGSLPQVNALLIDPANPDYIHLGTSAGYFYSIDGGQTWTAADGGLPASTSIYALVMTASRRLLAGTGAGLFLLDVSAPQADLAITKTGSPNPVTVGNPLTYTLHVSNGGPSAVSGVTLTDTLPPTVVLGSVTPTQGNCSGAVTVTCNLGTLANAAGASVTIGVTPTALVTLSNTASVTSYTIDPNTANNVATATTTVVAQQFTLTVTKGGTGSGQVISNPAGINCGATCSVAFDSGTSVTLTATPAAGSSFTGWTGEGCSGTGTCTVTMTQARTVTAAFDRPAALSLSIAVNQPSFRTGDSLVVSVSVVDPGLPSVADFYFGALMPDGDTVVFFTNLAFASGVGSLKNPATLRPIVAGVDLTTPFTFSQPAFFAYPWTGGEAPGTYTLFVAAVKPGSLADNSIDPGDIVALSTAAVTFSP